MTAQATSRIERAGELIGRTLLTLDEAISPGEVKDVLVDPRNSALLGFTLRGPGMLGSPSKGVVPIDGVVSIGRDAVMVRSSDSVLHERDAAELRAAEHADVIGREAISAAGVSLGTISDVMLEIDMGSAVVVGYEIAGRDGNNQLIAVAEPVAVSGDALVLPDDAERRATSSLAAFQSSIERVRA